MVREPPKSSITADHFPNTTSFRSKPNTGLFLRDNQSDIMFHDLPPAEMQKYREIVPTGDRLQCVATSRNYSMCRSGAWLHIVSSSLSTTCPKSDRVRLPSRSTVQSRVMRDGSNDRRELSIQSDRSRVNSKSSLFGSAGRDMDIYEIGRAHV